jgi:tetratricopeptide (TPR) repeat protein
LDIRTSSEAKFRAALAQGEQAGDRRYCAEVLTQVARAQGLQRNFDGGHQTLDCVAAMGEMGPRLTTRCLLERGRLYNSANNAAAAEPLFHQAFEIGSAAGEENLTIDAAHMLGICEKDDEAIRWNERALELSEKAADPKAKGWTGSLLNNLGWTYHDRGDFAKALELFERALAFRQSKGQAVETRIAKWAVARTYRSLGKLADALAMQRDLHAEWTAAGGSDGFVEEELAECLHALGQTAEARQWFGKAAVTLSADPWFVANEPARLKRLRELAAPAI